MNNETLTVSELNKLIKNMFDTDSFFYNISLKGEISNLKYHMGKHIYLSLKDETSKINAVIFNYQSLGIDFELKDGMQVEVIGRVSVYESTGSYQIYIKTIKQAGLGDLHLLFEQLKAKLFKEGLFDESHKKKLPRIPKKVGVITASTGAAVHDIITTINRRYPLCEIIVFPSLVQGNGAKENLVKMIDVAEKSDVDVIIIGRGGGSIEDLWAFNEEIVARAIYNCSKPIVSAVGHEIDFTISDFVADLRAATPTAAAELVVPSKIEILRYLSEYKGRLYKVMDNRLVYLNTLVNKFKTSYVLKNPLNIYEIKTQSLSILIEKLDFVCKNQLNNYNNKLNNIKTKLELLNPINVLKKGYSILENENGVISSKNDVKIGDKLKVIMNDGNIITEVKEV